MGERQMRRASGKKWILALIALAVILLAALLILNLRITEFHIEGNSYYSEEEIEQLLFSEKWDTCTLVFYLKNHFGSNKDIPFIERYQVELVSLNEVSITVYEKNITACVYYLGCYIYFDRDGMVVDSSSEQLENVPLVSGLKFDSVVLGETLPVEDESIFQNILTLSQQIVSHGLEVDKIYFTGQGDIVLYMDDLIVNLGDDQLLDGKLNELAGIVPELADMSGTLYLDTYTESAFASSYVFKPSS